MSDSNFEIKLSIFEHVIWETCQNGSNYHPFHQFSILIVYYVEIAMEIY